MTMPRKLSCQVAAVTDHGGRVYTVDLTPKMPVPSFRSGQFLHLTVDDYDPASYWPESRVFSIASSPRDRGCVRICYSVKGRYTTKMEQTLAPGMTVWIKLPYGEFVVDDSADAVLIAGGTGISAFTAFIDALTPADERQVTLLYGARTPELWIFQDRIKSKLASCPRFCAVLFAESGLSSFAPPSPHTSNLRHLSGRISLDAVCHPPGSVFYLSGPPAMLKAFAADLAGRGIPPERIRTDAWE